VNVDLQIGAKGFLMMIFINLGDCSKVVMNGRYFLNNAILFILFWTPHFIPEKEKILVAPIWEIVGIANIIGNYVKVSEITKSKRFLAYSRICVYMNVLE